MSQFLGRGLHGQVVQAIASGIVGGEYLPGDLIDPDALTAELGVSRTVVREALRVLSAKGLVDARPHRGTVVRPRKDWSLLDPDLLRWRFETSFDFSFLNDLAELRILIEPGAASLAARRREDADLEAIDQALADMIEAGEDADAFILADLAFHRALLAATHNELLERMETVIETGLLARDRVVHGERGWVNSSPDHMAVAQAVRARQPEEAEAAMRALLQISNRDLTKVRQRVLRRKRAAGTDGKGAPARDEGPRAKRP